MTPVIRMESVVKCFGTTRAVDGLTMEVPRGTVMALLGLNGCGKTTAFRMLAGLLRAESGTVTVLGEDPWNMAPASRRRIGYLSEKDFPFPQMNFADAATFTSRFFPSWDPEYQQELLKILAFPTRTPYAGLSRGQQRKFALTLTLAPKPDLLLLDDPAQGLDVTVRRDFIEGILPLLQGGETTILFTSHILSDVERLADSVAILRNGRVVLQEPLDALKEEARRVVVAASEPPALTGTLRARQRGAECLITVLRPDPAHLDGLRRKGVLVDVQRVGLEDLFVDVVQGGTDEGA